MTDEPMVAGRRGAAAGHHGGPDPVRGAPGPGTCRFGCTCGANGRRAWALRGVRLAGRARRAASGQLVMSRPENRPQAIAPATTAYAAKTSRPCVITSAAIGSRSAPSNEAHQEVSR